jgi:two-component system sensor histidine kinase SenX3
VDTDALFVGILLIAVGTAAAIAGRWSRAAELRDATDRIAAAGTALATSREETTEARRVQELTLGSMREGVLLVDGEGRTVFANQAISEHLGDRPTTLGKIYPPTIREAAERAVSSGNAMTVEIERGTPSRWLRVTATSAGDDGSALLVVTDITESRRIEAVRRDFVANASHELKTPAASIQAAAETLRHAAEEDPDAVPRFAAQLERDAVRLSRIVADLLDLSRLESGGILDERVRLDALVREEGQRFESAARDAKLRLEIEAPETPPVVGSARDLSLLIRNLVDNAIRYTPPEGSIRIRVKTDDGSVLLAVEDSGLGIPSRDLPRIFERFYRVDRARSRETGGTGLGLAIVKHVAENHGGTVAVRSELGHGSTFEIRLPEAPPDRVDSRVSSAGDDAVPDPARPDREDG